MSFEFVTENQLDVWVKANALEAQRQIPTLIADLVAESCPRAEYYRFPRGDSNNQGGFDGCLKDIDGYLPFVPAGETKWEIGTGGKFSKLVDDYKKRTCRVPEEIRQRAAIVLVTPRSGVTDPLYRYKGGGIEDWLKEKREEGDWKDVRVVDGAILTAWIMRFPVIGKRLVSKILGFPVKGVETVEERWHLIETIGAPPFLTPRLFLSNRDNAIQKFNQLLQGDIEELKLLTRFPTQVAEFACAYIVSLDEARRQSVSRRALFISDADSWSLISESCRDRRLVLIAESKLRLCEDSGYELVRRAKASGHSLIYDAPLSGPNEDLTFRLQDPQTHQIERVLLEAGHPSQRVRRIGERSRRNLSQVLRMLDRRQAYSDWDEGSYDLVIALLAGSWYSDLEADQEIIEELTDKKYTLWIRDLRLAAGLKNPLVYEQDTRWVFGSRFDGWYSLGHLIDKDHLEKICSVCTQVFGRLGRRANLYGNGHYYFRDKNGEGLVSLALLEGLAETLALMGSHPTALSQFESGEVRNATNGVVRRLLTGADVESWANLDEFLPLLAEASPEGFLNSVEEALEQPCCPFERPPSIQYGGILGIDYPHYGLLRAIESTAWDQLFLSRACVLLGRLARVDLGRDNDDRNRPLESLHSILCPLLPQTLGSVQHRISSIRDTLEESSDIAWDLLHGLFPNLRISVIIKSRPAWRDIIPEEWEPAPTTNQEYNSQIEFQSDLVVRIAQQDLKRLGDSRLYDLLPRLSHDGLDKLLRHLLSEKVIGMPEGQRHVVWQQLARFHQHHSGFPEASWSLPSDKTQVVGRIVEAITPKDKTILNRMAFGTEISLLIKEGDDRDEEEEAKRSLRLRVIRDLMNSDGLGEVIRLAESVEYPNHVGQVLAAIADPTVDEFMILHAFAGEDDCLEAFFKNYILGRWQLLGWAWVDAIISSGWKESEIRKILGWLPFVPETWDRARRWLGDSEDEYWQEVDVRMWRGFDGDPSKAIGKLLQCGRGEAAIKCFAPMIHGEMELDQGLACRALLSVEFQKHSEDTQLLYTVTTIIETLQSSLETPKEYLLEVEWQHLDLMDHHYSVSPVTIEEKLSSDPEYFYMVLETRFRGRSSVFEYDSQLSQNENNIRKNAFSMLHNHWHRVPGLDSQGQFQQDLFSKWMLGVKLLCGNQEILEESHRCIGEVLLNSPEDPDGLWIHRAVANALNDEDANVLRSAYCRATTNPRGLHEKEGTGQQERKLSRKYQGQAEALKAAGFHLFAAEMSKTADRYDKESDDAIRRDSLEG